MIYTAKFRMLVLFFFLAICVANAQLLNNAYFFENLPQRHIYNPAFQPINTFYLGVPLLSNFQFRNKSDLPTFKQSGFAPWRLIRLDADKNQILNSLSASHFMNTEMSIPLLESGFRYNRHYFTLSLSQKFESNAQLSKGFFETFLNSINLNTPLNHDFSNSTLTLSHLSEFAFGYSKMIDERFTWGAKLKLLFGHSFFDATSQNATLYSEAQGSTFSGSFQIKQSSPYSFSDQFDFVSPANLRNYLIPSGLGAAVDLGFRFKPLKPITFALAVTNIGAIQWNKMLQSDYHVSSSFDQVDTNAWLQANPGIAEVPSDTIFSHLKRGFSVSRSNLPSQLNYLTPALNASIEVSLMRNLLNLGVLSRTYYYDGNFSEDLTASVGVRLARSLNAALSYSILNTGVHRFGLGASANLGFVNIFASADYVPVQYAAINPNEFHSNLPSMRLPVGFHADRVALSAGFTIAIGTRRDSDGDGISDRFDRCPYTPLGVQVNRFGCPIDSDGDGVPDYLDKCPNTPAAAIGLVRPDGCPIDSDGDGVPDYLDKCQGTQVGAKGHVDEFGCPIDSDGDGIPDFLDFCPNTPEGIEVDSNGCPIDSDGDGVPDFLDLCSDTPAEARGYVDVNGCLLDNDDDGIPDYLDLCPNTPFEARGFVNSNGCPIDADDDGVPDFQDKCPNTSAEARNSVDICGCPRDSDGDAVPDYLDHCPFIPGTASNFGCPVLDARVISMLSRANQSIRFAKDTLKLQTFSFELLDEIAVVLMDSSYYELEIQGHTDSIPRKEVLLNAGIEPNFTSDMLPDQKNAALKMQISEEYARQVKNYLNSRGVSASRLHMVGMSDSKPIAPNNTEAGRLKNNRVELYIVFSDTKTR